MSAESHPDRARMLMECMRSPVLRKSVTFHRFLELMEAVARKLEAGEDVSQEVIAMQALRPAIEAERRALDDESKPN